MELTRHGLMEEMKDVLFPKFCVGCNLEGDWLCEKCFLIADLPKIDKAVANLDGVTALFEYGENSVSKLIRFFKYNYLLDTVDIFRKIIFNTNFNNAWSGFVIIPVPLHARRERERGFNQSEILAKIISEKFGLAINQNLKRVVYTAQQAKLSGDERRKNLKDAFAWVGGGIPEKVLLVDDVFTTGATMQECAKVLKNNGVKIVSCLVLARG